MEPLAAAAKHLPSRFQTFEPARVHRSAIQNAPYNPRDMSDESRRRLKENIGKKGLQATLTWNKRTGNLVAGHQRLSVIDSLEGTKDYWLDVAVVDLDDKAEREQNLFMNNPLAHGDWNIDKLAGLFKDDKIDADAAGFAAADIYQLFGDVPGSHNAEYLDRLADGVRKTAEMVQGIAENVDLRDHIHFYSVVVFKDNDTREAFTDALGFEDNRFVDGRALLRKLNLDPDDPTGEKKKAAEAEAAAAEAGAAGGPPDADEPAGE